MVVELSSDFSSHKVRSGLPNHHTAQWRLRHISSWTGTRSIVPSRSPDSLPPLLVQPAKACLSCSLSSTTVPQTTSKFAAPKALCLHFIPIPESSGPPFPNSPWFTEFTPRSWKITPAGTRFTTPFQRIRCVQGPWDILMRAVLGSRSPVTSSPSNGQFQRTLAHCRPRLIRHTKSTSFTRKAI